MNADVFWGGSSGGIFSGDDLEAVGEGGEAHFAGDFFAEPGDGVGGEGDDSAGVEIEKMIVVALAAGGVDKIVVGLLAAAEVDLLEQPGIDEVLDGAVDSGL